MLLPSMPKLRQQKIHFYMNFGITQLVPLLSDEHWWNKLYFPQSWNIRGWKSQLCGFFIPYPSSEQSLRTLFHMWREFTHLPLPSSPTVPHTAAPFPTMVVTGTTKLYTEEFIQGKFTAKGSNNRYLPISQVKLITLTLIITTDTEYSCEPTWSPGGTCSGIGEGSNAVGSHFTSKLPWPG